MALLQAFGILSALSAQSVILGGFGLGNPMSCGLTDAHVVSPAPSC